MGDDHNFETGPHHRRWTGGYYRRNSSWVYCVRLGCISPLWHWMEELHGAVDRSPWIEKPQVPEAPIYSCKSHGVELTLLKDAVVGPPTLP